MGMNMEKKLFSVVVPIYQVEDYVRVCIDSILAQTFLDYELILVDDGSKDGCSKICDEYKAKYDNVIVIHKENGGLVSARNAGIKRAEGEYICYVDGDDRIAPELLQEMADIIRQQNAPDMIIYSGVYDFGTYTRGIPLHLADGYYDKERLRREVYPSMIYDRTLPFFEGRVFPAAWNKMYKRELLIKHYCQDERIGLAEDNAFTYECLYYAESVYVTARKLYYYNKCNTDSMVSSYNANYYEKMQLVCDYLKQHLGNKELSLDYQLNAYCAGWIIMAIFHEARYGSGRKKSVASLKKVMKSNRLLKDVFLSGLPIKAKGYIMLLKLGAFSLAFWCTKRVLS